MGIVTYKKGCVKAKCLLVVIQAAQVYSLQSASGRRLLTSTKALYQNFAEDMEVLVHIGFTSSDQEKTQDIVFRYFSEGITEFSMS